MSKKKPIEIIINKKLVVEPDGIYESKVVPSGTGAVINFYKKFIGKEVLILIKDKITKGKPKKKESRSMKEGLELAHEIAEANG